MSNKLIIITLVNILLFTLLLRLIIGSFKEIIKSFWYFIKPNIASIIDKDYDADFKYTHKLLFALGLMVVICLLEFYFFYYK